MTPERDLTPNEFHSGSDARMYDDLAWTWPYISKVEEYERSARLFARLIEEHASGPVRKLLDIGCGGGHNDHIIKDMFEITGVDLSERMLEHARALNPGVRYLKGDMRTLRLVEKFDAVEILDAIAYMRTEDELASAFTTAYEHLRPGGVFLTFAEDTREGFSQNRTRHSMNTVGDVSVTLIWNEFDPDPEDSTYECTMVYLIRRGKELEVHTEGQVLGLFPKATWSRLLEEVGFEVFETVYTDKVGQDEERLPLFVSKRPDGE